MIYADYNATSPVLAEAREALEPFLLRSFGNPSAVRSGYGLAAKKAVDEARSAVARLVGATEEEVIFVSGGTESCAAAIIGAAAGFAKPFHVLLSSIEHPAVEEAVRFAARHFGACFDLIPISINGEIDFGLLAESIRPETRLISAMFANNETGVILPIRRLAAFAHERQLLFHTDAVQGVGKVPLSFNELGCDYLSLSGHKFGAVKGIGALVVRNGAPFEPLFRGGGQEAGRRGGTEAVPAIAALGAASRLAEDRIARYRAVSTLRDELELRICSAFPAARINCANAERLPNTSSLILPGVDANALASELAEEGFIIGTGSACHTQTVEPSKILLALGISPIDCLSAIRISLGPDATEAEVSSLADVIIRKAFEIRDRLKDELRRAAV